MKVKEQRMRYIVGEAIHELLEQTLLHGYDIVDVIRSHSPKIATILWNYYRSDKYRSFKKFFEQFNRGWRLYTEQQLDRYNRPDIMLVNDNRKKIVIIEIKTGQRTSRKFFKAIMQLCRYYKTLKIVLPHYSIRTYIFWAKEGKFEQVNCEVKQLVRFVNSFDRNSNIVTFFSNISERCIYS